MSQVYILYPVHLFGDEIGLVCNRLDAEALILSVLPEDKKIMFDGVSMELGIYEAYSGSQAFFQ